MDEFTEVRHVSELEIDEKTALPVVLDGVFYIEDSTPYMAYKCPCGCGNVSMLTRNRDGYSGQCWRLEEREGKVSLSPSVLSSGFACKSHYFIRDNKIIWC